MPNSLPLLIKLEKENLRRVEKIEKTSSNDMKVGKIVSKIHAFENCGIICFRHFHYTHNRNSKYIV